MTYSLGPLGSDQELQESCHYLDSVLAPVSFLVGDTVTLADYEIYGKLAATAGWLWMVEKATAPAHLLRWYNMMSGEGIVNKDFSNK